MSTGGASQSSAAQNTQSAQPSAQTKAPSVNQQSSAAQGAWGQGAKTESNPNPNAQGGSVQQESQTQEPQRTNEPRKLGESDLDALVTVKINGETKDLTLKEVIKLQQLEQASHEKMRQAAEIQRKAQEFMQLDIDRFAQMKGLDLDSLAEERLAKKYELMQMSPEQRRLHELESRESQRAQMETAQKNEIIDQIKQFSQDLPPGIENASPEQLAHYLNQVKQVYTHTEQSIEKEFVDAWKDSGLPKHKYFGALMAFHMMNHQKRSGEPLQAAQAASIVRNEFSNHVREITSQMDAKAIQDLLGKDVLTKLREFEVQRVTANQATSNAQQNRPAIQAASGQKKQLNQQEWRKAMGLE